MASEQLKAAVDRLQQATAAERDKLKSGASAPQTPEQALGLKFNRGDTVRDLLTGLRGTVRSGQNGQVFGRALYQIDLADGRISFRSEGELEKDTTPAPAPGR